MIELFTLLALLASIAGFSTFSAHGAIYCMILSFLFSGIVYYLLTSSYLAMMLFVVYVGAVAMLFVFCVMLLNLSSRPGRAYSTASYYFFIFYAFIFLVACFALYYMGATPSFDVICFEPSSFWPTDESWAPTSKDHFFTSSMYEKFLPYLAVLGIILFFVTVIVTVLFIS
jgi:NADH:ubiquinone oxidoreductase subunit 6 (subunit J)